MRIAFIGQKGFPAGSGGVEVHVEAVGTRLAGLGHDISGYVRPTYGDGTLRTHGGMRLKRLPTARGKHLDTLVHCTLASLHVVFSRADIVHFQAHAPSGFAPFVRLFGKRTVSTVHALEYDKAKWGRPARLLLRLNEWQLMRFADEVIAVAPHLVDALEAKYHRRVHLIPNGVDPIGKTEDGHLERRFADHGLTPKGYLLFLGRLVPEKNADFLIRAYVRASAGGVDLLPLVIAGGASGSDDHVLVLQELAAGSSGIHLVGTVLGDDRAALFHNARGFVLPSSVEGHPIVLLEALSCGLPVLASDISAITQVGGLSDGVTILPLGDEAAWTDALRNCDQWIDSTRDGTFDTTSLLRRFDWDAVAAEHVKIYEHLLSRRPGRFPRVRELLCALPSLLARIAVSDRRASRVRRR